MSGTTTSTTTLPPEPISVDTKINFPDKQTGDQFTHEDANEIKKVVNDTSSVNLLYPVILFIGESNSGGVALNSDAQSGEIAQRSIVQILNNDTLIFEDLKISNPNTNNLLGHAGLTPTYSGVTHGWELELANQVANGDWSVDQLFLLKCGQGGSMVSEWNPLGSYFQTFINRVNTAKSLFKQNGITPAFYVWFSLGINDAIAGTDLDNFKTNLIAYIKNIRIQLGFCPIMYTEIPNIYNDYNSILDQVASADGFMFKVETSDAPMQNTNHWNYVGMKMIADRMKNYSIDNVGLFMRYMLSQNSILSNKINSVVIPPPPTNLTWTDFENCSTNSTTNALEYSSGDPSGARVIETVDATQDFEYIIKINDALGLSGIVTFLDNTPSGTNVWQSSTAPFISGVYAVSGALYKPVQRGTNAPAGITLTSNDVYIRVHNSVDKNDVIYEYSEDYGMSWNPAFTHVGVLTGQSIMYLRTLFAVTGEGEHSVLIERIGNHIISSPTTTTSTTQATLTNYLELKYDDLSNFTGGDPSSVGDWNVFFDFPNYGDEFLSVTVVDSQTVRLYGLGIGNPMTLKDSLFISNTNLLEITDGGILVSSVESSCFNSCTNMTSLDLSAVQDIGDAALASCDNLNYIDLTSCSHIGSTVNDDSVFSSSFTSVGSGTLIVPISVMTRDSGNPDGDIVSLQNDAPQITITTV